MSILVSVQNLEKSFGSRTLFHGIAFGIEEGDRVGLIGPNGAGKSTLLKILAGEVSPDDGNIVTSRGLHVGYLEQAPSLPPGVSIREVLEQKVQDPQQLASVDKWMARLNLTEAGLNSQTPVDQLSGGWQKKIALVRELIREPHLLLLDEPTNHLDIESILWLEDLLARAQFATLTITHDRLFLQRVANRIFDLDRRNPNGLLVIQGTYADYLAAKEQQLEAQARREEVVTNTLRRETAWLRRGAKARQTKQKARIERAGELGEEAEVLAELNQQRRAQIDFQAAERHPKRLIDAQNIAKSYDNRRLFESLDLLITPRTRLGLLGKNGSGKSTLIRVLTGVEAPDEGQVRHADALEVAHFEQQKGELNPDWSVLQAVAPEGDYVNYRGQYVFARSYLSRFLFRPEQMDMPIEKLSGGEKSRLRLAQLMLQKANVLVLDEPTNDLDMETLNVLEDSLQEFDGAVILVSHDRYFLDQISDEILAFDESDDGTPVLERFAGYNQWEEWKAARNKTAKSTPKTEASTAQSPTPKANKRRLGYKEKRELENMEETILEAESKLENLQAEAQQPEAISNASRLTELYSEISELEARIQQLYSRWAELEALQ